MTGATERQDTSTDLAGSVPLFPKVTGNTYETSVTLREFNQKKLIFNGFERQGEVHVYRADCRAGERLRVQLYVPVLSTGGSTTPSFAVIAKGLPYSADAEKLPLDLPAGYSAVVAPRPSELVTSVHDVLTRARYYGGPVIDARTLVGGHCYIVAWSPRNKLGKYVLQCGHRWPLRWHYWAQLPRYWWQIRGWFGMSRTAAWLALGGLILLVALLWSLLRRGTQEPEQSDDLGEN